MPGMKGLRQETWSRVKKGEKSALRGRKVGECFQWKATDSVQEETPVVLTTGLVLVNEHNHPLPLREGRHRLTEESLANVAVRE